MITRRIRRSSLESQHFPSEGEVIIARLPFSRIFDVLTPMHGGTVQWTPMNNSNPVQEASYLLGSSAEFTDDPNFPSEVEYNYFPDQNVLDCVACRSIEFFAEEKGEFNPEVESVSKLRLIISYSYDGNNYSLEVPFKLTHIGAGAMFSWDLPEGAVLNDIVVATGLMSNLRLTLNFCADA